MIVKIVKGWSFVREVLDMSLVQRIVVGILVGILFGIFFPTWTFISILGTLFVSCLKAIAPILVFLDDGVNCQA